MWFVWQQQVVNDQPALVVDTTPDTVAQDESKEVFDEPVGGIDSFTETVPMYIAQVPVMASVADTASERQQGLSGTPYLPDGVVKLFVFESETPHGFWMKDMLYDIDIAWVRNDGTIVHIEPNVPANSYPTIFRPDAPALYVIETQAGFLAEQGIIVGDTVTLPAGVE